MTARFVEVLERAGRDPKVLPASIDELVNPAARVPYDVVDACVETCARELGAAGLSVALLATADKATYDAAGLVLVASPTFGEGLTRAFAYQRLWGDGERFTILPTPNGATVRFRHPGRAMIARAVLAELALLETFSAARMLVGPDAVPVAVRFAHAELSDLAPFFGVVPTHEEGDNEIVFDQETLDAPIAVPPEMIAQAFAELAERALAALPKTASLADRIRALAAESADVFSLGVGDIAEKLRLSSRTLQRKLRAEGTSWADIVDDLRRERAAVLTARGTSEKEISFLLGFADPSALARARARWR